MTKTDETLRKEFENLIESYKITDSSNEEDVKNFLDKISTWLIENTPKKLYRYRSCSDYNITSLENDEIWGSSLSNLNDSFEGMPSFDLEKINQDIKELYSKEGIKMYIENYFQFGYPDRYGKMLPPSIKESFDKNLEENLKNKELMAEKLYEFFNSIKNSFVDNLNKNLEILIEKINNNIEIYRSFKKIACFSTTYRSALMWGLYADEKKGFVVEYDMSEIIKKCPMTCNKENLKNCSKLGLNYLLAPVIYRKQSYDGTDYLIQEIMYNMLSNIFILEKSEERIKYFNNDILLPLKLILNKSDVWKNEAEWRLIANLQLETKQFTPECILKCKPKKIFLGEKMTKNNRERIIKICNEKNIEYEETQNNYFSNSYSIETKSYFEKNNKPLIKI